MEEENVKNRYLLGTIGALIGAFIGSIPWILMYVFGNMMVALLSIIIVICSYYGYKITKAKIDKKLPIILSITSFIAISVTTLVIIPLCLLASEGFDISFENLQLLYQTDEFVSAIIQDYIVSLLFCVAVIGGIIVNLNKQIKEGVDSKDIKLVAQDAGTGDISKEDIEKVQDIFDKNDAMDKKHTITKELVMEDIQKEFGEDKANRIFNYLTAQRIIRKKSGKYYFFMKAQKSALYRYGITSIITFIVVIAIAFVLACVIIFFENRDTTSSNDITTNTVNEDTVRSNVYEIGADNITLQMTDDITILTTSEIEEYLGSDYVYVYDCIAVSEDFSIIIMVFTDDKSNYEEEYTAEEYLKMALDSEDIEVQEKEINGNTFYIVEETYEGDDGTLYKETDCIYDAGDRFICMIFDSEDANPINIEEIIK